MHEREAVHMDPVWRDPADFIIAASIDPGTTGTTTEQLAGMDVLVECSSDTLAALDARDEAHAQQVADVRQEREDRGHLVFETGRQR